MLSIAHASMGFTAGPAVMPSVSQRAVSPEMAIVVGVAADSGCGKSTFMRRMTSIFGGDSKLLDIGRETNTLVSEMTTVICLDDYHKYDREGRKGNPEFPDGITALAADCQDWDKMAADVLDLKAGATRPVHDRTCTACCCRLRARSLARASPR
jgi:phosphoribulokinase